MPNLETQVESLIAQTRALADRARAVLDSGVTVETVPGMIRAEIQQAITTGKVGTVTHAQFESLVATAVAQLGPCASDIDPTRLYATILELANAIADKEICCGQAPEPEHPSIERPAILAPASGATGVSTKPVFSSSAFAGTKADTTTDIHAASTWEFASDAVFVAMLHSSGRRTDRLTHYDFGQVSYTFAQGATVYARVTYESGSGLTATSLPVVFTVAGTATGGGGGGTTPGGGGATPGGTTDPGGALGPIAKPLIVEPIYGACVPVKPEFQATPYMAFGEEVGAHASSDWGVGTDANTLPSNNSGAYNLWGSTTHLTTLDFDAVNFAFDPGQTLYVRVRYRSDDNQISAWSDPVRIHIQSELGGTVVKPQIVFPEANATDIRTDAVFCATEFEGIRLDGNTPDTHVASTWEFAADEQFSIIVHSSGRRLSQLTSYDLRRDGVHLTPGTLYYVRVTYEGTTCAKATSDPVAFITHATQGEGDSCGAEAPEPPAGTIATPEILTPEYGSLVPVKPAFTSSPYTILSGDPGAHVMSTWAFLEVADRTPDEHPALYITHHNTTQLLSFDFQQVNFRFNQDTTFYARVRYHGANDAQSNWSNPIELTVGEEGGCQLTPEAFTHTVAQISDVPIVYQRNEQRIFELAFGLEPSAITPAATGIAYSVGDGNLYVAYRNINVLAVYEINGNQLIFSSGLEDHNAQFLHIVNIKDLVTPCWEVRMFCLQPPVVPGAEPGPVPSPCDAPDILVGQIGSDLLWVAPACKRIPMVKWATHTIDTLLPNILPNRADPNTGKHNTDTLLQHYASISQAAGLARQSGYDLPSADELRLVHNNRYAVDAADASGANHPHSLLNIAIGLAIDGDVPNKTRAWTSTENSANAATSIDLSHAVPLTGAAYAATNKTESLWLIPVRRSPGPEPEPDPTLETPLITSHQDNGSFSESQPIMTATPFVAFKSDGTPDTHVRTIWRLSQQGSGLLEHGPAAAFHLMHEHVDEPGTESIDWSVVLPSSINTSRPTRFHVIYVSGSGLGAMSYVTLNRGGSIAKPSITFPANFGTINTPTPVFTATPFSGTRSDGSPETHYASRWHFYAPAGGGKFHEQTRFSTTALESYDTATNPWSGVNHTGNLPDDWYQVAVTYIGISGRTGTSDRITYRRASSAAIAQPTILIPSNGATSVSRTPTLECSAFAGTNHDGGAAVHQLTTWEVSLSSSFVPLFEKRIFHVANNPQTATTFVWPATNPLPHGTQVYARVAHTSTDGLNATSPVISFTTEVQMFTVGSIVSPSGGGTVTPATQSVASGSTATFTVTPNSGYTLSSVQGQGGTLSGNTYTTGPITSHGGVTAFFQQVVQNPDPGDPGPGDPGPGDPDPVDPGPSPTTYTVTATSDSGGSISPSSQTVNAGGTVSFVVSPVPESSYTIQSVSGCGGTLNGNVYTTGPVNANCTVTAVFTLGPDPCETTPDILVGVINGYQLWIAPGCKRMRRRWWSTDSYVDTALPNISSAGAPDPNSGQHNTNILVSNHGNLAQAANAVRKPFWEDAYSGTYHLPSKDELALIHANRYAIDAADQSGIALLARIEGTAGGYLNWFYGTASPVAWSSSEHSTENAWGLYMANVTHEHGVYPAGSAGQLAPLIKRLSGWVFPVRRVPLVG